MKLIYLFNRKFGLSFVKMSRFEPYLGGQLIFYTLRA